MCIQLSCRTLAPSPTPFPPCFSPPPGKVFCLSLSLALSTSFLSPLCSCGLLSVTSTQQVPLLGQNREKERSCERDTRRERGKKSQECVSTHQRSISLTSERAEERTETDGQRQAAALEYNSAGGVGRARRVDTGESTGAVDPGVPGKKETTTKKLLERETESGAAARISPGGQHFTATTKRGDS